LESTRRKKQVIVKNLRCLVIDEVRPETSHVAAVGVRRQEGWPVEGHVDGFDDDEGLEDGAVAVEEYGDPLVGCGWSCARR
jgi:hypothetical protein